MPRVAELRDGEPERVVVENARRKARAGLEGWSAPGARAGPEVRPPTVLGVDTDVALAGRLLGKADDAAGARARLEALSGREHEVLGGVCLLDASGAGAAAERTGVARTRVAFRALDEAEIGRYLASEEWRDRAGAYAVQGLGSTLVESVHGDLANVIGLPIALLLQLAPNLTDLVEGARKP